MQARKLSRDAALRAEAGLFLLEGPKLVEEALQAGVTLKDVFVSPTLAGRPGGEALLKTLTAKGGVHEVDDDVIEDLASVEAPQGVLAVAALPQKGSPESLASGGGDLLLAASVQDPGNAGALARIAAGFGFAGVVADRQTADFFSPKAVRGSAGAVLRIPVFRVEELAAYAMKLRDAGVAVLAAVPRDGEDPTKVALPARTAIVVGGEGRGIPDGVLAACTGRVTIPMSSGLESLNVATAAAVLAYAVGQRRRQ